MISILRFRVVCNVCGGNGKKGCYRDQEHWQMERNLIRVALPDCNGQTGERLVAQRRVYHKRKGICEKNRGVENVTVWYASKIVATGGKSTLR